MGWVLLWQKAVEEYGQRLAVMVPPYDFCEAGPTIEAADWVA